MGDEPTNGETRAERIKRKWNDGESERAARRAEREAARRPEREAAVGLLTRMGHRLAGLGWRMLLTLVVLAVVALPPLGVWALVDSDAWMAVGGVWTGICACAAVIWMSAGTDYSGDW
jgi:hypothetical protein